MKINDSLTGKEKSKWRLRRDDGRVEKRGKPLTFFFPFCVLFFSFFFSFATGLKHDHRLNKIGDVAFFPY